MKNRTLRNMMFYFFAVSCFAACGHNSSSQDGTGPISNITSTIVKIENRGGKSIAYSSESGVSIIQDDNLSFKDLNKNGKLDKYEDWRLDLETRASDLASQMSTEQIAGLMLYSNHQAIPAQPQGYFKGTYNGKTITEGGINPSDLTDQQKQFLEKDNLRHVLLTRVQSPMIAAEWNNKLQAYCEKLGLGIPANNSSDPRHGTVASAEYDAAAGGDISMWPSTIGMAATFDPALVERFGEVASTEYRALGITTALSPQIDIATDPRWSRFSGTFGENPYLSAAMAKAYVDGFQNSDKGIGWGEKSVNAMVKHWPGGGSGEGGRDAHYGFGKYAVYPGNNFDKHLIPFTQGAFNLNGLTKKASAVMPYYTISWNQTPNEEIGNSYSTVLIKDLLRIKNNYDGVICTDWGITHDHNVMDNFTDGKPWGVEHLSEAERHYKLLMAGVDQFGGNNDADPIVEAYRIGVKEIGEEAMRMRMEQSAVRLLRNIFQVGLFENPYLSKQVTDEIVGNPQYMKEGYEAQLKSIVMLKNKEKALPIARQKMVYVPKRKRAASRNFLGMPIPVFDDYPINTEILNRYFVLTDDPDKADYALVFIQNPKTGIGYDATDVKNGGTGYMPISLQYAAYTATTARKESIAGGDPLENFTNRSYRGKRAIASNYSDLEMVRDAYNEMKGKPVIVCADTDNPMVVSEFESMVDALILGFKVQDQVYLDVLSGNHKPTGLLPFQMPANMATVERQAEDVPQDMDCHVDTEGNKYDFGFGMDWDGVKSDGRAKQYN